MRTATLRLTPSRANLPTLKPLNNRKVFVISDGDLRQGAFISAVRDPGPGELHYAFLPELEDLRSPAK